MSNSSLHIENLIVGYDKKPLLPAFQLEIKPGELIGIKGRNGQGKTTLLKTIAGLIPCISGKILLDNKNLLDLKKDEFARYISIVLTDRIKLRGITVFELAEMGCYPNLSRFHFKKREMKPWIEHCLARINISHLSSRSLSELSDGELQKAMIARALVQNTPMIIMDEPTAFLDYVAKEELFVLLKDLVKEQKVSILFSSHDIDLMDRFSDNILEVKR